MLEQENTMQRLIRHFEDRLQEIERYKHDNRVERTEPRFPMLVLCLGEDAIDGSRELVANLFRLWPQYKQELLFLGVQRAEDGLAYSRLENADTPPARLSPGQVRGLLTGIFSTRSHFRDKNKFCIYYVLNTTSFADGREFAAWADAIRQVKADFGVDELEILDMLILQLNEDFTRRRIARRVRNHVAAFYTAPEKRFCQSVFLLSNKRNDNTLLEEWGICNRIVANVIALSNNPDSAVSSLFFKHRVFTASYAHKEKPTQDIGQVVVENLIDKMADMIEHLRHSDAAAANLLSDKNLPSRLGRTKEETLAFLDEYVDNTLVPQMPPPDQLEYFPRRDTGDYGPMCELPAAEFNEVTMNAWDCYLSQLASKADTGGLGETYAAILTKNFFVDELIFLGTHLEPVRAILSKTATSYPEMDIRAAAAAKLKTLLSSDPAVIDTLMETVRSQGKQARAFVEARTQLCCSREKLFPVTDDTVRQFYTAQARNYFDQNEEQLETELRRIREISGLVRFLEGIIDGIIDSNSIFSAPFEEEFEMRLCAAGQLCDAKCHIRQQLTINEVYTYLPMNFVLGEQLLSAILLKADTSLYENLTSNLDSRVYYYNTGYGDMAESIVIYEVSVENLVSDEGE